ncbi:MAG: CbiX/SirB N-terminal domain-containing protein [Cyanobacteria bacterium J06626_18]
MLSAYLLVSHGSSDPRHKAGLSRIADTMRQSLDWSLSDDFQTAPMASFASGMAQSRYTPAYPVSKAFATRSPKVPCCSSLPPAPVVGTATLEATHLPLAQQIAMFAQRATAQGFRRVVIVPLFLLPGIHVKEDLPREIATAQSLIPPDLELLCVPHLGSHACFKRFVASRLKATTADRCLLLAHGSRRRAGNRSVRQLGTTLDVDVAFWAVDPDLETQVIEMMQQGYQHIVIAPYFLFPGSITDAITRRTEDLAERLSRLSLRLLAPLGTSAELGRAVAELALSASQSVPMPTWERDHLSIAESGITA